MFGFNKANDIRDQNTEITISKTNIFISTSALWGKLPEENTESENIAGFELATGVVIA
jgi:hypothetical protein